MATKAVTKLANLIDPQVIGQFLDVKMGKKIKFAPLARVDNDLQGNPGSTITVPVWEYIGDAEDLAEGVEGDVTQMNQKTAEVKVKKAVKNVELTDEAVLSGYGNPVGEANNQLLKSISQKVDQDCVETLRGAQDIFKNAILKADVTDIEDYADALVKFGEDLDEETFLLIPATEYAKFRKHPDFVYIRTGEAKISGQIGMFMGMNIIVSDRLNKDEAFILRAGAFGIALKRGTNVETERYVKKKTSLISVDMHYVTYLRDVSKFVKITLKEAPAEAKAKKVEK